jgi:hypothetical protein
MTTSKPMFLIPIATCTTSLGRNLNMMPLTYLNVLMSEPPDKTTEKPPRASTADADTSATCAAKLTLSSSTFGYTWSSSSLFNFPNPAIPIPVPVALTLNLSDLTPSSSFFFFSAVDDEESAPNSCLEKGRGEEEQNCFVPKR